MRYSKEEMKNLCDELVEYIKTHYEICVDLCGEDDEVNTKPAEKILEKAKILKAFIDCFIDGMEAGMQLEKDDSVKKKGKWLI